MYAFTPNPIPSVAIAGSAERFPVHRIYCVGRNYAEHAKEMGAAVERTTPTFFTKPPDAVVASGSDVPYPPATADLHHEVELVVALHSGGRDLAPGSAPGHVFGYAVGLDLTRRDLQSALKARGLPWDVAKAFDASAPLGAIAPAASVPAPGRGELWLEVNGVEHQRADVSTMIFGVPAIIVELSRLFELRAGDLIFTGTPAGVGPLVRGDRFRAGFAGLPELTGRIV
jgi:fumarylpyruvate hydrolase